MSIDGVAKVVLRESDGVAEPMTSRPSGLDDPAPSPADRACLRSRALKWLQAELEIYQKEDAQVYGKKLREELSIWKADAAPYDVRQESSLARIPEGERIHWRALWAGVDALHKKRPARG
jgi:hypothetical protein